MECVVLVKHCSQCTAVECKFEVLCDFTLWVHPFWVLCRIPFQPIFGEAINASIAWSHSVSSKVGSKVLTV